MKRILVLVGACACALALVIGALSGCSGSAVSQTSEGQTNRSFMSQVNEIMSQFGVELESFVDAVSRGDVVNMRTQADNAYQVLDKLSSLEAPEELSDVKQQYIDGANKMREALDAYIDLYTEIDSGSFDQSKYEDRIEKVQALYDEGVSMLKAADEAAASKQ